MTEVRRRGLVVMMTVAHERARAMDAGTPYRARLAQALRQTWADYHRQQLVDRLCQNGGKKWQKGGHHWVYFNNLAELYGLHTKHYGTGNVSYATLDGEHISNNGARQILGNLQFAKVWYNCQTGQFEHQGLTATAAERIVGRLQEQLAA